MANEQIKQNAADYVYNFQPTGVITEDRLKCYIAGAHSRDEEIEELNEEIESLKENEKELFEGFKKRGTKLGELMKENVKLRNPWISVKEKRPPIKTRVLFLDYNGKAWFGKNTISGYAELESDKQEILPPPTVPTCKPIITHWMPIPEIPTKQ